MMMPHIAARVFNTPLMINRAKLDTILSVLQPRLEGENLPTPEKPERRSFDVTTDGIAIIPILGTLVRRTFGLDAFSGLTSYGLIASQIDEAVADPAVRAILLDIDSPGGEAGGVFDLADRIYAARSLKPIWAVANEDAFSAAYALAASAECIFLPRTAGVGSIGVIAVHLDQSQAEAHEGLSYTAIFAGERKNDMTPHEPLSDPARVVLQEEVNRVYDLFVNSVARMRGLDVEAVKATEAGLFMGENAIAVGLADYSGTFEDALTAVRLSLMVPETKSDPAPLPENPEQPGQIFPPQPVEDMRLQAHQQVMAYAAEITQLCQLAGLPDKAADMIARHVPVAQARKALLEAKAITAEATTISGQIPSAGLAENPKAKIDTAAIYAQRNAPIHQKEKVK